MQKNINETETVSNTHTHRNRGSLRVCVYECVLRHV